MDLNVVYMRGGRCKAVNGGNAGFCQGVLKQLAGTRSGTAGKLFQKGKPFRFGDQRPLAGSTTEQSGGDGF